MKLPKKLKVLTEKLRPYRPHTYPCHLKRVASNGVLKSCYLPASKLIFGNGGQIDYRLATG